MLRLLGPLELSNRGREHDLGGPRQRVVLAMLALNANRVVPLESLIDAVWDTTPPPTARAQVQICVSALRKIFIETDVPLRIRTRTPGYQLEIPPDQLDTAQFVDLVTKAHTHAEAGRTSEAVAILRTALGLWRGEALADLHSELVRRGADQLEHSRLAAVMERVQLDLALGRHEELVGELTALVEEHPLRERLYEFLMLALYRSGRQAEALEVCRRARYTLVEELGIEPGKDLQRLEKSILNRVPELDLVSTAPTPPPPAPATPPAEKPLVMPRRLPASIADFTGRAEQLAAIRRVLSGDDDQDNRFGMRIVAISGKGGVGKSTLAIRAAHELRDVYPDGHLYADLEAPSGVDRMQDVLDRFLRALGVAGASIPVDAEEKADMYRSRVANLRMLVVLDGATRESEVLPLLPAGPGCAVIVTSRSPLSGLPGAELIAIDPFDVDLSLAMLAKIIGAERMAAEHDAAIELVDFCGRLPLAMRIAGARLASRPHWRLDVLVARLRNTARRLDELTYHGLELRSSIGLTYRVLRAEAKALFRLFSLITTPDFPGWTAAALLERDPFDAEEVLEHLVETQLLDTVAYPGEHPRYRFHDLIRVYAQERLREEHPTDDRRAAIVRLVGAWLAKAEDAHRKEYGGDYTILHGAGPRLRQRGGPDEKNEPVGPMDWLESERRSLVAAVHLAAEAGEDELCWDLALTSVTLFEVKGHIDDWRDTSEVALAATTRAGNRRGQAAMRYSLGSMAMSQRQLTSAEEHFDAALEIFRSDGDTHGSALVLRNAAMVDRMRGRSTAMLAKYHESLRLMRAVGDPVGEAGILNCLAKLRIDDGNLDHARELLDTALECTRQVGYLRGEAQVVIRFAELYLCENQVNEAHRALNRVLLIVRSIGDRIGEAHALYGVGVVRQRAGRLDNAKATLQHAHSLARQVGERLIEAQSLYALGEIALARGNSATGLVHLAEARQLFADFGSTVWQAKALIHMSDVHQGAGELDLARQEIRGAEHLLALADSKEAERLSAELRAVKATLVPDTDTDTDAVGVHNGR